MKGRINTNFDVTVFTLEGKVEKKFYNFNEEAAEEMYNYYVTNDDYVVKVEASETFYDLLQVTEPRKKR